jgi:hypothetical protein
MVYHHSPLIPTCIFFLIGGASARKQKMREPRVFFEESDIAQPIVDESGPGH